MARVEILSESNSKGGRSFVFDVTMLNVLRGNNSTVEQVELEMRAAHDTGEVGLKVSVPVRDFQQIDPPNPVFHGSVTFQSLGPLTDRLLRVVEVSWGFEDGSDRALPSLTTPAVALTTNPRLAEKRQIQLKLVFDPGNDDDAVEDEDLEYAELYLVLDLPAQRAWLEEKDWEYRNAIVGWLTGRIHRENWGVE